MYEEVIIDEQSTKNLSLKEGLSLHRFWYTLLNKIFERERKKSKALEDAFQNIKTMTGIVAISQVVENFLTREQSYNILMETVKTKEEQCSDYKKKVNEIQDQVSNFINKENKESEVLNKMKAEEKARIKEILEISPKKYFVENTHSKVKTWVKLMIRKFNHLLGKPITAFPDDENLVFYVNQIKDICVMALNKKGFQSSMGKAVENNREFAIRSIIKNSNKKLNKKTYEDVLNQNELVGIEVDNEENNYSRIN